MKTIIDGQQKDAPMRVSLDECGSGVNIIFRRFDLMQRIACATRGKLHLFNLDASIAEEMGIQMEVNTIKVEQ